MANFKQIIAMCFEGASYAQITHALGCSRRDVSRAKTVINDEALTLESFRQLPPGWFDARFYDGRSKRTLSFDQPDFQALARKLQSNKHLTRHKLWMDYLSQPCASDETKYQYLQFCSGLNEFLRANDLVEVITHEPGQVYREPIGKRFSGGWKAVFWRSESGGMGVVPAPLGCGAGTVLLNSFLWRGGRWLAQGSFSRCRSVR